MVFKGIQGNDLGILFKEGGVTRTRTQYKWKIQLMKFVLFFTENNKKYQEIKNQSAMS